MLSVDQLWKLANEELIRVAKEDRRVERKHATIRPRELSEYFSMWANTAIEGGLIAIGVADKGAILGCLCIEIEHINRLESETQNYCADAHADCRRIPVKRDADGGEDFVLLFRVHYNDGRVVHHTNGDAFIRRGETKHRLTAHEIRDLQNDKGEVRVEQELCPTYTFPDDFRPELVAEFLNNVRNMPGALLEPHTDEELLVARRLGAFKNQRFIPNGACVLLLADDPMLKFPGAKVRFLRFEEDVEGTGEQWNAVKDVLVEGPIPFLIQTVANRLDE